MAAISTIEQLTPSKRHVLDAASATQQLISRLNKSATTTEKEAVAILRASGVEASVCARWLHSASDMISPTLLGACLGHHDEYCKALAREYPLHFNFKGMGLVSAIRCYLYHFRLPGESAQIERILEGFSRAFFECNTPTVEARWDPAAVGWYVLQPRSGKGQPCCIHCGRLDAVDLPVRPCRGCNLIHFCRICRKLASHRGHSVAGNLGYGRACVAALNSTGKLGNGEITFCDGTGGIRTEPIDISRCSWEQVSPFRSQDAVMVLSYAIIMLTTNLHNPNVKIKMEKHEFIRQNNTVNDGGNFPGDYLSEVYDDILSRELKVMKEC